MTFHMPVKKKLLWQRLTRNVTHEIERYLNDILVKLENNLICKLSKFYNFPSLRPGSDAVLLMSRIKFHEFSSCEVRRLNQFETADIIRIGLAVLHAWLSRE